MKKLTKIISAFLLSATLTSAFAIDFGVLIDNDTKFKTNAKQNYYLNQKNSASAWIKVPFGQNYNNYFIAEGTYKFEYNQNLKTTKNFLDLSLLKAVITSNFGANKLEADIGRFVLIDLSGLVYTQNADGVLVDFKNRIIDVSLYAGYTGLLNGNTVSMINANDSEDSDQTKLYDFAEKNVIAMATVSFPYLFADQTLAVQGLASLRMDKIAYNRIYASMSLKGPVIANLFYNIDGTIGFISYNNKPVDVVPLVKGDITYYFPIASVGLNATFAGKDFAGITSQVALNSVYEPEYSNLLKAGISGTVKPIENLVVAISGDIAFDGAKNFEAKGAQYKIDVNYQLFSDVMIGAGWLQYFDLNKTDFNHQAASIKAKISF